MKKLEKLFPTMVIGSLPRPQWVQDVIAEITQKRISEEEADRLLDTAILFAIRLQERAGLDYISDGEWRRENYVGVFADRIGGFSHETVEGKRLSWPHVTSRLEPRRNISCDDAEFLRRNTERRIMVPLPSPFTIGLHMWHPELSADAYPTREEFVQECVTIIRQEVIALSAIGVDAIQLDEPWQAWLSNPSAYHLDSDQDIQAALELSVKSVNQVTEGLDDLFFSVHLCHSHRMELVPSESTYNPLMDVVNKIDVGRFAMEFNSPASGGFEKLNRFPEDRILGLGVINPISFDVETVENVISRVEAGLQFVSADRIVLNPDCGFATSAASPQDLDVAYRKLCVMCEAAESLRSDYD